MRVTIIMVMARREPFTLVYADEVKPHLRAIEARYHSVIRSVVETQLLHEPDVETRNRKPLKRPIVFGADWELRIGPDNRFRVFYQVNRGKPCSSRPGHRRQRSKSFVFRGRGVYGMKIASVADMKARLSAYLKESQEGPVIVTRNGKAVAVLLAVTDDDESGTVGVGPFAQVPGASRQVAPPDRGDRRHSTRAILAGSGRRKLQHCRKEETSETPKELTGPQPRLFDLPCLAASFCER